MSYLSIELEDYKDLYEQEALVTRKLSKTNEQLKAELAQLKRLIFSSKSEKFVRFENTDQLNLFTIAPSSSLPEAAKETIKYQRNKKQHKGRNPIPEHLPVEEIIIEPQQDVTGLKRIGEERTETLKYKPASLIKKVVIRPKYAEQNGDGIVIAKLPSRTFPKLLAENCLLTYLIVNKIVSHLPFYRQIQILKREYGLELSSSTINDWFIAVCTMLEPLYHSLQQKVLSTNYLQVDESPIKVMDSQKAGSTHQGYMWVYHNPKSKMLFFNYRKGRGFNGPKEILTNFEGALQSDGYKVYDKLGKLKKQITQLGCLAHLRRKFFVAKDVDPERAKFALEIIQKVYAIEKRLKESESIPSQILQTRREQSSLLFSQLKQWLDENELQVLPKSQIGKAIRYALLQWPKIIATLEDGRYQLDNNWIENSIRPLALGRKNYMFAGSHPGAERLAMMYSFFGSCKMNRVNPSLWLKETLDVIHEHPINKIDELLPINSDTSNL